PPAVCCHALSPPSSVRIQFNDTSTPASKNKLSAGHLFVTSSFNSLIRAALSFVSNQIVLVTDLKCGLISLTACVPRGSTVPIDFALRCVKVNSISAAIRSIMTSTQPLNEPKTYSIGLGASFVPPALID